MLYVILYFILVYKIQISLYINHKAVGSCSILELIFKITDEDERPHNIYFILAYVVSKFGQQFDDPLI